MQAKSLPTGNVAALRSLLSKQPVSADAVCTALGISQPTFSRLRKQAGNDVVSFGAARATMYGLARDVGDLGSNFPVYRITESGTIESFGELITLQNDWHVFIPANVAKPQLSEGLPFFIQDMRPQGFLGRIVPTQHEDLKLPPSINDWSDDHALVYLLRRGDDAPGNLVIGNESYRRLIAGETDARALRLLESERIASYSTLAVLANRGTLVGSSAGGEQPKFVTRVARESGHTDHVIVKFSPTTDTASGRRWADLIVCEHLASNVLHDSGIEASKSEILEVDGRVFLEVVRFDRIGETGRAPMVSLAGIDGLLGMMDRPWSHSAAILAGKGLMSHDDLERVRLLDLFGALIGNTDRHPGNLSLSWNESGAFALLPVYDMLPMMYRPNTQGEVVDREFDLSVIDKIDTRALPAAMTLATTFWDRVLHDSRVSAGFKEVVRQHVDKMSPRRRARNDSASTVDGISERRHRTRPS